MPVSTSWSRKSVSARQKGKEVVASAQCVPAGLPARPPARPGALPAAHVLAYSYSRSSPAIGHGFACSTRPDGHACGHAHGGMRTSVGGLNRHAGQTLSSVLKGTATGSGKSRKGSGEEDTCPLACHSGARASSYVAKVSSVASACRREGRGRRHRDGGQRASGERRHE